MSTSSPAKSFTYRRRQPEETVLYKTLAANVETFIADRIAEGKPVPDRVAKELRDYLKCGILQYGFVRVFCPGCPMHGRRREPGGEQDGVGFCPAVFRPKSNSGGYANDSWGPGNIWNRGCQVVGHDEVDGHLSGQQAMASENGHRPDSNC